MAGDCGTTKTRGACRPRPSQIRAMTWQGVAVIHVEGTLVHRTRSVRTYSGMLGYNAIRSAFLSALTIPEVRAIVLLCNSPGGEVSGCFDLVDPIYRRAASSRSGRSATIWPTAPATRQGSAADRLILRTGGAGSVGVITMHADWTGKGAGRRRRKVNIFQHGARARPAGKSPALSNLDKAEIQGDIDAPGDLFDETAVRNRGSQGGPRARHAGPLLHGRRWRRCWSG